MDVRQLWFRGSSTRRSFYPFSKSDAIRAAFYRSVISIPSVDTALMCFWMSRYAEVEDSLQ